MGTNLVSTVSTLSPRKGLRGQFAQAAGRTETADQTDQQTFYNVLSKPENRYLVRQQTTAKKTDAQSRWINELVKRRNANIAAVALANA